MKTERHMMYALQGIAILRHLEETNTKMRYAEFAQRVGIMDNEHWSIRHRQVVSDVLDIIRAVSKFTGDAIDTGRVVNASGQPGAGYQRDVLIATTN